MHHNPLGPVMTTSSGTPVADNQHSLTVGAHGPLLWQDWPLMEKLAAFNRERIPERVVHAKGWGAWGTFTATKDLSQFCRASVFSAVGKKTPVLARFSTALGESGAADAERDLRGFAVKFFTDEGNWDMVGSNSPVFFIRDPMKFPDLVHSQKRNPHDHLRSNTAYWDFLSLCPESMHQITFLMGERGLPASPRFMNGYGGHTFSIWNVRGERFWVKFHFKSQQGHKTLTNAQACALVGEDRESCQRDLYGAIEAGQYPRWTVSIQWMPEQDAMAARANLFDATKVWPQGDHPLIEIGELELNRNPQNYFAEVEQAAFSPANVVPGIGFSPDRILQGRLLAYADAQRHRIGTHYNALPVNAPRCPVAHGHQDGAMRFFDNVSNPAAYYEPNSFGGPTANAAFREPPWVVDRLVDRHAPIDGQEDHAQVCALFRRMSERQRQALASNIAHSMKGVPVFIVDRALANFDAVTLAYGNAVRAALQVCGVAYTPTI
ncbi:MAG TPA: catalase [Limnobacter sp.]|nr:catalase [Limnobacter sp.]